MENYEIADILKYTSKLMELHGENAFKIRSYQNANFKLDRLTVPIDGLSQKELEDVDGIGPSLSIKIHQLLTTGTFPELEKLLQATPPGVLEMLQLKGIGPKKVAVIWKELEIETLGELLYACNENRLIELKGFGAKTQQLVKDAIEFRFANQGNFHFAAVEKLTLQFLDLIHKKNPELMIVPTGMLRRKCEILQNATLLFKTDSEKSTATLIDFLKISELILPDSLQASATSLEVKSVTGIPLHFLFTTEDRWAFSLWKTTGSEEHIQACFDLKQTDESSLHHLKSETEIYQHFELDYIEPELREGLQEIEWAKNHRLPKLVDTGDLRGILHNHTTDSDGLHSLEKMAKACKDLGYEYLGICDHSKTAFYANGLSIERVLAQQKAIEELNIKMAPFKIFKGIESDILSDGSLDYPQEILATFDFIVASVHSGLKMDKEKATDRVMRAVRNPYTTILGHPTGRLLLAREGYPLDHKAIIDACAEEGVVIELNAHPYRLDLDWRWIQYALSKGVKISINPDAHAIEGYQDMYYGICVARKGGLSAADTFNAFSLEMMEKWFEERKKRTLALK